METAQFIIGGIGLALGGFMILRRDALARRQRSRSPAGQGSIPSSGWAAAGALFIATGVLQMVNALV